MHTSRLVYVLSTPLDRTGGEWRRPPGAKTPKEETLKDIAFDAIAGAHYTGLFACGPYWVVLRARDETHGLEVAGLDVRSYAGRGRRAAIDVSSLLRRLPLTEMVAELRREYVAQLQWMIADAQHDRRIGTESSARHAEERLAIAKAPRRAGTVGRRPLAKSHYRDVARVYSEAWLAGASPTRTVAESFYVTRSAAAKWVTKARSLGFLPKTERGIAFGRSKRATRKENEG
jgi:hypothetical protein